MNNVYIWKAHQLVCKIDESTKIIGNIKFFIYGKCLINWSINVIPLILKFTLNNEKFSLKENNIFIHHYIEHLKISYEFPDNYNQN